MKKTLLVLLLLLLLIGITLKTFKNTLNKDLTQIVYFPTGVPTPVPTLAKNTSQGTQSLFVPYWTLGSDKIDTAPYQKAIYFGITPAEFGINTDDPGANNLSKFLSSIPAATQKDLAIRMIDTQANLTILKDTTKQQKIITGALATAKAHNFNGLVLDLEISAIPFDTLVQQINTFVNNFYTQSQQNHLTFSITVYGDTFYRLRPLDIKTLAKSADTIMIMAYDFHKAGGGSPGPNFPLSGSETYGYDLQRMIDDFLKYIPPQKLTVVFGLFGYDWTVDSNNKAIGIGIPLTDKQIQQKFLNICSYENCHIQKDPQSAETKITYTDSQQANHILWFEDQQSVQKKENILKQTGINSFSYWANSYF